MKTFFMDLEFLCDVDFVYEDDVIAICLISKEDDYELTTFVRPYGDDFEVSSYCTELTGISKDILKDQPCFDEIYDQLLDHVGEADEIVVWGNVDLEAIYKLSIEIAGELEFNIVDFQDEFMKYCGLSFRPGLKKVYDLLTGDFESKHHDVRNDTVMLAAIYKLFREDPKGTMRKVKGRMR